MPTRSKEKLLIHPGVSRSLALMLLLSHAAALAVVPPLQLGLMFKLLLATAVVSSLTYYARRDLLGLGRSAVVGVEWSDAGGWGLIDREGNCSAATLLGSSYLHRYLLTLNFRLPGGTKRRLILTPDSVDADQFRRLRARLEWARPYQGE